MRNTLQNCETVVPVNDRRRFLKSVITSSFAVGIDCKFGSPLFGSSFALKEQNSASTSKLVDAHLHCFAGPDDTRFPYHKDSPYRPPETATPEHLLKCMNDGGINYAVVVHPEPYQDDHRWLEHCLNIGAGRLKGTCLIFCDRPDAVKQLQDLSARLPLVAARVHAYAPERLPPFESSELRLFWKTAGELNLAIQLHLEPRYAERFESLIRDFPGTRVIIDHLGRPMQGTPKEHDVIVRWAEYPHTLMKLSAIPSPLNYPHRDPRPIIQTLLKAYGSDRILYGGGFSGAASGASYRAAFDSAKNWLSDLSSAEQAQVLGGNACRLFGFPI